MNINFSNIWKSPGYSIAGVLTATVLVCTVLSQQGVTIGHVGTTNWVSLVAALATGFLGLFGTHQAAS